MPWALLVAGSAASLAANVAVAEPTMTGRVIAAWPSFSLIAAYELLMRQVRRAADAAASGRSRCPTSLRARAMAGTASGTPTDGPSRDHAVSAHGGAAGRKVQIDAWR